MSDHLGYVRCGHCSVLFDPVTGHRCYATDDEQLREWIAARVNPDPPRAEDVLPGPRTTYGIEQAP